MTIEGDAVGIPKPPGDSFQMRSVRPAAGNDPAPIGADAKALPITADPIIARGAGPHIQPAIVREGNSLHLPMRIPPLFIRIQMQNPRSSLRSAIAVLVVQDEDLAGANAIERAVIIECQGLSLKDFICKHAHLLEAPVLPLAFEHLYDVAFGTGIVPGRIVRVGLDHVESPLIIDRRADRGDDIWIRGIQRYL